MKLFRKVLFWCHLTAGVTAGLVILIMCVTGALLAFQPQVIAWAEQKVSAAPQIQPGTPKLGVQELVNAASETRQGEAPTAIAIQSDQSVAPSVTFGRSEVIYLDPYTGKVQGEGANGIRAFFETVTSWHRWLGGSGPGRDVGKAITGVCNAVFLVLAITGLYLWWPRNWTRRSLKAVTVYSARLTGRARYFNWHNVTGVWCSIFLIFITATGLVMSYQWANNLLYTLTGNTPPAQQGRANEGPPKKEDEQPGEKSGRRNGQEGGRTRGDAPPRRESGRHGAGRPPVATNLNQLMAQAEQQAPGWRSINLRFPSRPKEPITFSIEEGVSTIAPHTRATLTVDSQTGEVLKWEPYSQMNLGRKLRLWVRPVHTGEAGRLPGQLAACLASLGGAFLVFTGLLLAYRRLRGWLARRRYTAKVETAAAEPEEMSV